MTDKQLDEWIERYEKSHATLTTDWLKELRKLREERVKLHDTCENYEAKIEDLEETCRNYEIVIKDLMERVTKEHNNAVEGCIRDLTCLNIPEAQALLQRHLRP